MKKTKLQELTIKERLSVIEKFQNTYKTKEDKAKALSSMNNSDIDFLIYCMDNINGKIFYSKFKK